MKEIRVWFYMADIDGKYVDNAIKSISAVGNIGFAIKHKIPISVYRLLYSSHVEIEFVEDGLCYTSTMGQTGGRAEASGVRCEVSEVVLRNRLRWFCYPLYVSNLRYREARAMVNKEVLENTGYDTKLLFRFIMPNWMATVLKLDNPTQWICSEFVIFILMQLLNNGPVYEGLMFYLEKDQNASPFRLALYFYMVGAFQLITPLKEPCLDCGAIVNAKKDTGVYVSAVGYLCKECCVKNFRKD